jgi:nicotinate phosphoribosyltransferase
VGREEQVPTSALFADYYAFTMLRAYFEMGMTERAAFSLFARSLPPGRSFLLACGLADLLIDIESLRFGEEEIGYLSRLGDFPEPFLDWLRGFRFTGDIHAMREGTPFFPEEPVLEVVAPIAEAQLVETLVLNQIGVQTILASKAARVVAAARGRRVSDFGARRAQGKDAAIKGARAFFIAGVDSTSNVASGLAYGLPLEGTMAHSFIEACETEEAAFAGFSRIFPGATLLVDTYDTIAGVGKAIALARRNKFRLRAIRLDSGDLDQLSRSARKMLDEAGMTDALIVASGGLDETHIDRLTAADAPIDVFGVGSEMAASADAPILDIAYKLTEYAEEPKMKLSAGKRSLPGRKQVFRQFEAGGAVRDVIALREEVLPGAPLLQPVMLDGKRVADENLPLGEIREHARQAMDALPAALRALSPSEVPYDVAISAGLASLEETTRERLVAREVSGSGR